MAKEKNENTELGVEAGTSLTQAHYDEKGAKSKEQMSMGGNPVEVDIINTTMGRITKDFGSLKKGHVQAFSAMAYEIYDKAGVIEKVN